MAEEGKRKVQCSDTKAKMNAIDNELSKIVGMKSLELSLAQFLKGMLLDERRRALGLEIGPRKLPHLAFRGDSGTGKSMVARMLGKLLHLIGILPSDKVTEVRATDLQDELLEMAEGGILLVNNPAFKMLKKIIQFMDSGKAVVILAGKHVDLDYILFKYVLAELIQKAIDKSLGSIKNGHIVDKMLVKAKENLDSRVDVECMDRDSWITITSDDFTADFTVALAQIS